MKRRTLSKVAGIIAIFVFTILIGSWLTATPAQAKPGTETTAFTSCADVSQIPQAECEALVAIYNNLDGPNWTDNSNWLQTTTPCSGSRWSGVSCSGGRVYYLNLGSKGINGNFPPEISNFTNLRDIYLNNNNLATIPSGLVNVQFSSSSSWWQPKLDLSNNQLSGSVPAELFSITNLKTLNLSNNQFTSIEPGLSITSTVQNLYLSDNQLSGSVPAELFNFNNLDSLQLSNNAFTTIPSGINTSSTIRSLGLDGNQFSGNVPTELFNFSNLDSLNLSGNQFSAVTGINTSSNLRYLNLGDNQFSGGVPGILLFLNNLRQLNLSNNQLTSIPRGPYGLPNITSLALDNNQLQGSIPKELFNLNNLSTLNLSNNYFTSIEAGINIASTNLYQIDLSNNQLQGTIPAELFNWPNNWGTLNLANNYFTALASEINSSSNLYQLNVSNNLLSVMPTAIGNLSNLNSLDWSNNGLIEVPFQLLSLNNLQTLNLSNNQLSSAFLDRYPNSLSSLNLSGNQLDTIPAQIQNLSNLSTLNWSNNGLTTFPNQLLSLSNLYTLSLGRNELNSIPSSISTLSNLNSLDWSNNGLTTLPVELFNLTNLQTLDLSSNQLSALPNDLLTMQNLSNLNLSLNQISGAIPTAWGNFPVHEWNSGLDLAGNQLTGSIPPEFGNLNLRGKLDLSLNQLTGAVPPELGNLTNLSQLRLSDNQLSGSLPISLTQLSSLTTFCYGNNSLTEPSDTIFQSWLANIPNLSATGPCDPVPFIDKTASVDMASPGDMIEYTISISVAGSSSITTSSTSMVDVLPSGLTYVDGSLTLGAFYDSINRQILYTLNTATNTVTSGIVISYQVTVDADVAPGTIFQNMAVLQTENARIERAATVAVPDTIELQTLLLIYASGDNNLGTDMVRLLNNAEMQADNPNVITLMVLDGPGDGDSYLYRVQHDTDPSCPHYGDFACDFTGNNPLYVEGETVWNWPENVASPHSLAGFVKGAMWAYPNVDQVVLSLVGHGNGWSPNVIPGQPGQWGEKPNEDTLGGMLWDLDPGDSLSSLSLKTGLDWAFQATGRKIGLLYMDACSMAASEVAYEVRDYADYMLASENTSWASFAYDKHLNAIDGTTTPDQIGQSWLETEAQLFRDGDYPFTLSLTDLSQMDNLRIAEDALATALIGQLNSNLQDNQIKLQVARNAAACFESNYDGAIDNLDSYCDLSSFAQEVANQYTGNAGVVNAAQGLQTAVSTAVVAEDHESGDPWPYTPPRTWSWGDLGGLTKYLPLNLSHDEPKRRFYNEDNLLMAKDGQWDEFLTAYWDSASPPIGTPLCPPACDDLGEPLPLRPEVSLEVSSEQIRHGDSLSVPVAFDNYEQDIASVNGVMTFDTTCLHFDGMSFDVPSDFNPTQTVNGGTIDFTIADQSTPRSALPTSVVATIDFSVICDPTVAMSSIVEFSSVAFGDTNGNSVIGSGLPATIEILPSTNPGDGIIVDNTEATVNGDWTISQVIEGVYGPDYLHDGNTGKGAKSVTFTPNMPASCRYDLYARWTAHDNRDTNVPIDIQYAGGMTTVFVNQEIDGGQWNLLGTHPFSIGTLGTVTIRNDNTTDHVIADAVRFVEVPGSCSAPGQASLNLSPPISSISISKVMTVGVYVNNISELYGVQLELAFDPTLVEVIGSSIQPGAFLVPDTTIHNAVDNNAGLIRYTVSLQGNKPGMNGSGLLANIRFRGLFSGTSPITFTKAVLGNPASQAITHTQSGAFITVISETVPVTPSQTITVTGQLILERRGENNNDGATVCAGAICITTAEDGFYTLPNVPLTETVIITSQGYLSTSHALTGTPGSTVTLPPVTLLGGDVNQDGVIDVTDGVLTGLAWNSTAAETNRWDSRADVTDDGVIDILDMIAIQFNLQEVAPGPWGDGDSRHSAPNIGPRSSYSMVFNTDIHTDLRLNPMVSTIAEVGTFTDVGIAIEEIVDMYGYSFALTFNPDVVQIVDANPNEAGVQVALGDFLDTFNQFVLVNQVDNEAGRLELAVTQTYPAEARSGNGTLSTITFKIVGSGNSNLQFADVQLVDDSTPEPQVIPANTPGGQVTTLMQNLFLPLINR